MRKSLSIIIFLTALLLCACGDAPKIETATLTSGGYRYRGEVSNGKRNGYGVLTLGDSVVYCGMWKDGRRCGYGTASDSLGRTINALWQADTIMSGTREDSTGTYEGTFDSLFIASGRGTLKAADGSFYSGEWKGDRRTGFGCQVAATGKVKVGEWRNDRYRGERMLHTSNRIYGIDISRHQHEKGRKRYSINWQRLRIVSLGSNGKQRSKGSVDYPISFIYIKCTEGTTVRNRYYTADHRQARSRGIPCGAYHFFSPRSSAAAQAKYFLKNARIKSGDLPPVLDLEPTEAQIKQMGGASGMFKRVRVWLRTVGKATGVKPVLYVGQGFVTKYLPQAPDLKSGYPIWIARYGEYRPDIRLKMWQLTPYGRVSGIHGSVDVNVFNGYDDSFRKFLREETAK